VISPLLYIGPDALTDGPHRSDENLRVFLSSKKEKSFERMRLLLLFGLFMSSTLALMPPVVRRTTQSRPSLAPLKSTEDDDGYDVLGTVLRAGPKPALVRLTQADKYERSVELYMAKEGCSRSEAQGNMDAYFTNANDWAYQKLQEEKGAPKYDYARANMAPKQVILTLTWTAIVFGIIAKIFFFGGW